MGRHKNTDGTMSRQNKLRDSEEKREEGKRGGLSHASCHMSNN